jgi:Zn-dependent M16 (insulinase) family peptidase
MPQSAVILTPGTLLHGCRLQRVESLPGVRAVAYLFEHERSGAQVLHVCADDSENCLGITFPTPPPDDTGLPHILEHAVLGGSQKFPVREPFFEMVKMSMATFINAMTSQAYTVYPVSSNVKRDFFNLAEVYLDAVFHPLLSEETYKREGHHFSLTDNADLAAPLTISGIVYSEMKGVYSTPESRMVELSMRDLFPDTPLGRDSGGDPAWIPALTYAQFHAFYTSHYHPSNALIFLYGDIPTEEQLAFLAPTLDEFTRQPVAGPPARQPRWTSPRVCDVTYPIGAADAVDEKTFITLNWLIGDALDPVQNLSWEVIGAVLLGNEGAPLKKALIDSRLGADLFLSGADAPAHELTFHVGIKGSEAARAEAFEALVLDTLAVCAREAFTPERVTSAFQQLAYHFQEVTSLYPLNLLSACNMSWAYGGDPLTFLHMDEHLAACRRQYDEDPEVFGRLIHEGLLANPHRLRAVLRPDPEQAAREQESFTREMAAQREAFSAEEIATLAREAAALEADQGTPNTQEALATLPQLTVRDLPPSPRALPTTIGAVAGIPVLRNAVFANGVNYLELDIDLAGLPEALVPILPRFCDAFAKMGAAGQSFTEIAARRAACTGGVGCYSLAYRHIGEPTRTLHRLRVTLKTLDAQADHALGLLGDLLFGVDPRARERLQNILVQARARYRSSLVNDGMATARRRAARGLSLEAAIDYRLCSRDTLQKVEEGLARFDETADGLMGDIEAIRDFLANRQRWTLSFTGSDGGFAHLERAVASWASTMSADPIPADTLTFTPYLVPPREGLAAPVAVSHCVQTMPTLPLIDPAMPHVALGAYLTTFDYLLPEIRLKGNAYGGGASYDDSLGIFTLYSYRDPRLTETLAIFAGVRAFVANATWTQSDIDRAIIGSAKSAEKPIRPGEATGLALTRWVRGDSDAMRARRYAIMLSATPRSIKDAFLAEFDAKLSRAAVCVVANPSALAAANHTLGASSLEVSDLLGDEVAVG